MSASLYGGDQYREAIKQFAHKLYETTIYSDSSYKQLLSDIEQDKLTNPIEFLRYCSKSIIVELKEYPNEPENYLEKIHGQTAALIPELEFTGFKFQIVLDSTNSDSVYKSYDVIVTLTSNGKTYSQVSNICPDCLEKFKERGYFGKIDQQVYFKIFNKILADIQSPYRLHEIKAYNGNAVDWNRFGIIALTEQQAEKLHRLGLFFSPSYESFKNSLTSSRIDSAIQEYEKLGLLAHLSPDQIRSARLTISQQENLSLNDVLLCFPNVIYTFDTEMNNLQNPYEELLNEMSSISHGAFRVTNITDNFAKPIGNKSLLKFSVNGKEYSQTLKLEDDWIDPSVFDIIKKVVSEHKLSGQFYDIFSDGQAASFIYLTPDQAEYMRTHKLLLFADQWEEGLEE